MKETALFFDRYTIVKYLQKKSLRSFSRRDNIDYELLLSLLISESFKGTKLDHNYAIGLLIKDSQLREFNALQYASLADIEKLISNKKLIKSDSSVDIVLGISEGGVSLNPPKKALTLQIKRFIKKDVKDQDVTEEFKIFLEKYRKYSHDDKLILVVLFECGGTLNLKEIRRLYNQEDYPFGTIIIVSFKTNNKVAFYQIKPNPGMIDYDVDKILDNFLSLKDPSI